MKLFKIIRAINTYNNVTNSEEKICFKYLDEDSK